MRHALKYHVRHIREHADKKSYISIRFELCRRFNMQIGFCIAVQPVTLIRINIIQIYNVNFYKYEMKKIL